MSEPQLGKLIDSQMALRDAIHVAIVPMQSSYEELEPGQHIGLDPHDTNLVTTDEPHIGIVDPFLPTNVKPHQNFWVLLYPGTVTGMRHHWKHPAFDGEKAEAERWLKEFAMRWGFYYDQMIWIASADKGDRGRYDDYIIANGHDLHGRDELGGDYELFWQNIEKLTGKQFSADHKDSIGWTCTC
jgi:hypothetical protein